MTHALSSLEATCDVTKTRGNAFSSAGGSVLRRVKERREMGARCCRGPAFRLRAGACSSLLRIRSNPHLLAEMTLPDVEHRSRGAQELPGQALGQARKSLDGLKT